MGLVCTSYVTQIIAVLMRACYCNSFGAVRWCHTDIIRSPNYATNYVSITKLGYWGLYKSGLHAVFPVCINILWSNRKYPIPALDSRSHSENCYQSLGLQYHRLHNVDKVPHWSRSASNGLHKEVHVSENQHLVPCLGRKNVKTTLQAATAPWEITNKHFSPSTLC